MKKKTFYGWVLSWLGYREYQISGKIAQSIPGGDFRWKPYVCKFWKRNDDAAVRKFFKIANSYAFHSYVPPRLNLHRAEEDTLVAIGVRVLMYSGCAC